MTYIYVLKLQSNKYYVGKTEDPNFRLETHFSSGGAAWTKKYKPISIHELRPDCESKDETNITQEYMKKYGIDNVRGGPWCGIDISAHESTIKLIIDSESDNCYKCGKQGHFSNQCANKYNKSPKSTTNTKFSTKKICDRCEEKDILKKLVMPNLI
jgi:predicted GIY-YIG superfamily endonuclease